MKKIKPFISVFFVILFCFGFVGCDLANKIQIKLGLNNEDFEYLNSSAVEGISIQSTRDPGFKFIVKDSHAISEMYNLLKRAKSTDKKTELEPDYEFIIDLGNEQKVFYYTVGAEQGNFYSDEKIYTVSNRLDEGIMQNLSVLREPKDFKDIYYGTLLEVIKLKKDEFTNGEHKIGVNIQGDVDTLKYVFSADIQNFLNEARKIVPNIEVINTISDDYDVIISLKNRGFSPSIYKTRISVNNKKDKIQDDFYVIGEYEFKEWNYLIDEPNKVPEGW